MFDDWASCQALFVLEKEGRKNGDEWLPRRLHDYRRLSDVLFVTFTVTGICSRQAFHENDLFDLTFTIDFGLLLETRKKIYVPAASLWLQFRTDL